VIPSYEKTKKSLDHQLDTQKKNKNAHAKTPFFFPSPPSKPKDPFPNVMSHTHTNTRSKCFGAMEKKVPTIEYKLIFHPTHKQTKKKKE
jgi:hypothetical protein